MSRHITITDRNIVEEVKISLKYDGPDVRNGKMALQDVIPVLQGFSGAYATLAQRRDPGSVHRIEITDVRQGSAEIVLQVLETVKDNPDFANDAKILLMGGLATGTSAFQAVKTIFEVIRLKMHVRNAPFQERVIENNRIGVLNVYDSELTIDLSSYEGYQNGDLDRDLERLTRPLEQGRIDSAKFEAQTSDENTISQQVAAVDRPVFEIEDLAVASTTKLNLTVILNSLTKSTNSGWLFLPNGKRAFYRYVGDEPDKLHSIFGGYAEEVQIRCEARMDDQLEVISVDIFEIAPLQASLFEDNSQEKAEDKGENQQP